MKFKKIWSIFISMLLITVMVGCNQNLTKGEMYSITTTQVEHATFKVVNRDESVDKAVEGQKLFVSAVFEEGYELDKIYVNEQAYDGVSFSMPKKDANVTISVKEIISNITITQSDGGIISCDKTSAKYGEIIKITVTPEEGYYINSRALKVNTAEVSVPPIYNEMTFEYIMPHTDVNISAQFTKTNLNRGINFGDYDHKVLAKNSEKWDYSKEKENNEVSIQLKGTGDGAKERDIGFAYYKEKADYVYFSTAVNVSDFSINSTIENRVGVFFGDNNKMGTVGYYFKKYSASNDLFIGRKYTSLNFSSGNRSVITGFQDALIGHANDGTDDKLQNGNVPTTYGGKGNISKTAFSSVTMKMGFVYDYANGKLHVLLNDFNSNELKYVRTISDLDTKYFTQNSEGKINFGLYAEAAHTMTFTFSDMECSYDKAEIEAKFPEIVGR